MFRLMSSENYRGLAFLLLSVSTLFFAASFHATFRLTLLDDYSDVEFTRVGYVSDSSAKIAIRYPGRGSQALRLYYRRNDSDSGEWLKGPAVQLEEQSDFTGVAELGGLDSDTAYQYTWIQQREDSVKLIPFSLNGRKSERKKTNERFWFKTRPKRGSSGSFTMLFGSCIKPNHPYGMSLPGFAFMAQQKADLALLLGDFIYVDINLNFGSSIKNYRRLYREVFGQPDTVQLLSSMPTLAMFDDHEILNNWDRGMSHPYPNAIQVFSEYLGGTNPPGFEEEDGQTSYFAFEHGDTAIFVLDTRTFRSSVDSNGHSLPYDHRERTMLGKEQLNRLIKWLKDTKDLYTFKIIATSVPFTFNWQNDDTWFGYQHERQLILDFIIDNQTPNVVFLSGDRHQIGAIEFVYSKPANHDKTLPPIVEFSVGPINQFWLPIPVFFDTENILRNITQSDGKGPIVHKRFPQSRWVGDKRLYYSIWPGFAFGKVRVDTSLHHSPKLIFCLYTNSPFKTPEIEKFDIDDVASVCYDDGVKEGVRPTWSYVLNGKPIPRSRSKEFTQNTRPKYDSSGDYSGQADDGDMSWGQWFMSLW